MTAARGRIIRDHWRQLIFSTDFLLGCIGGGIVAVSALRVPELSASGTALLLTLGSVSAAFLAVSLTALAIVVGLGHPYWTVMSATKQGIRGALAPFQFVATVAALSTVTSFGGAVLWSVAKQTGRASILGLAAGLAIWALVGTVQLVRITASHGINRSRLADKEHDLADELRKRRDQQSRSA